MSQIDYLRRTIDLTAVYAGPSGAGKESNLSWLHATLLRTTPDPDGFFPRLVDPASPAKPMLVLATADDRDTFFAYLQIAIGEVRTFATRMHLYTLPPPSCPKTRASLLTKADVIVFVVDSQTDRIDDAADAHDALFDDLERLERDPPFVVQYNKRDVEEIEPLEALREAFNEMGEPDLEAVATRGQGVMETFKAATKAALIAMKRDV